MGLNVSAKTEKPVNENAWRSAVLCMLVLVKECSICPYALLFPAAVFTVLELSMSRNMKLPCASYCNSAQNVDQLWQIWDIRFPVPGICCGNADAGLPHWNVFGGY